MIQELMRMPVRELTAKLKEIEDTDMLTALMENDDRDSVKKLCRDKIERLTSGAPEPKAKGKDKSAIKKAGLELCHEYRIEVYRDTKDGRKHDPEGKKIFLREVVMSPEQVKIANSQSKNTGLTYEIQ